MIFATIVNALIAASNIYVWSLNGSNFHLGLAFFSTAVSGFVFGGWLMSR